MLTDDQARDLLHRAADTIEVEPGHALPDATPRPRWPLLVASAAVVAVIVGVVVTGNDDVKTTPIGPPDRAPIEQPEILEPDQMPSLLGYRLPEARELLEAKDVELVEHPQAPGCGPSGIVTGTEPAVGARLTPGEVVKVFVTTLQVGFIDCEGEPPWFDIWEVIRFARGLGGPPDLADDLILYVDNGEPITISRQEAADPDKWTICDSGGECHSALAAIEQMATRTWEVDGRQDPDRPRVVVGRGERACAWTTPPPGIATPTDRFWVEVPMDGSLLCPATMIGLTIDPDHGRLAAVSLHLFPRERSERTGLLTLQEAASAAFIAWARGGPTPPQFADEVELLLEDDPWGTLSAEDASFRDSWSYCSGVPPDQCQGNPLRILDEYDGPVVQTRTRAVACRTDFSHLPADLQGAVDDELVRLDRPEAEDCKDYFAVELWITDAGEIRAVNLLP